jgi:transport and Golgi organization protein 2
VCTLVVNVDPARRCPVALVAVRDEMLGRPWDPPARHWPDRPGLVGGRDRQAGGTWLAYQPARQRVACVLNGTGRPAPESGRRSRGELPLLAASGEPLPDLAAYDPFHLVVAAPAGLWALTWNGYQPHRRELTPGTWLFVNAGLWAGPADRRTPRAAHFGPLFAAAAPDPSPDVPVADAWAPWLGLVDAPDLPPGDPAALLIQPADGGWGTSSVTLLAFGPAGERYDFRAGPGIGPWQAIRATDPAAAGPAAT